MVTSVKAEFPLRATGALVGRSVGCAGSLTSTTNCPIPGARRSIVPVRLVTPDAITDEPDRKVTGAPATRLLEQVCPRGGQLARVTSTCTTHGDVVSVEVHALVDALAQIAANATVAARLTWSRPGRYDASGPPSAAA